MDTTRRRLLIGTALSSSLMMVGGCAVGGEPPPHVTANPGHYFTPPERAFVEAAVDRLIPPTDDSPGGRQAGVAEFIDRQMAGDFGRATRWYMQGPWAEGADEQGYQMAWTPCEVYRHAIDAIARHCDGRFDKAFADLSSDDQDAVLQDLQDKKIDLGEVEAGTFFDLLLQNTQEGFFADPLYGGNRDFAGWTLIGFPGPRYDYTPYIEQYGEPYPLPVVGIEGRKTYPA